MTIKKFAFEVQSSLIKAHGIDLKRSHVHEVLASLLGFASYSALTTQRILGQHDGRGPAAMLDVTRAAARAVDLGYVPHQPPVIATFVAQRAEAERLAVFTYDELLAYLGIDISDGKPYEPADAAVGGDDTETEEDLERRHNEPPPSIDLESAVLRESLLRRAETGSASAHLALAQLDDEFLGFEPADHNDGQYWFEQQRSGRTLSGVELEWAEAYVLRQKARASREEHLRLAAELGSVEAALRQAEEDPSSTTFDVAVRVAGPKHAARLGELALSQGREEQARHWLRVAAQQGDTNAMKTLASELEPELKDAWTWVYLAELLGTDAMAYHAVGDDGLPADADEAGPLYPAGGFELDDLPDDVEALVRRRAQELYEALST